MIYSLLVLITLSGFTEKISQQVKSDSTEFLKLEELQKRTRDYSFNSSLDSTLLIGEEGVRLAKQFQDSLSLAKIYSSIGTAYRRSGMIDSSQNYFIRSAELYDSLDSFEKAGYMYSNIAVIFKDRMNYEKSIIFGQKAIELRSKSNDYSALAESYRFLGFINERMNNFEVALAWDKKARLLSKSYNDSEGIAYADILIGDVYSRLGIYDSALFFRYEAVELYESIDDKTGVALAKGTIGRTYYDMGDYETALRFAREHLNHVANMGYAKETAKANVNVGMALSMIGQDSLAIIHIEKGLTLSKSIHYIEEELEAYHRLFKLYAQSGDSAVAFTYLYKYTNLKDSIFNIGKAQLIETIQTEFDIQIRKQEVNLLKSEAEINELKIKQVNSRLLLIFLASIFIILILIAGYFWKTWQQKIKFAREEEALQRQRIESVIRAEERERKRIARELHDGLGQLLSSAKLNISSLEGNNSSKKVKPLDNAMKLIDQAVGEVRTISHNLMPNALVSIGLTAALKEQVHLINDSNQVVIHESLPQISDISETKAIVLYRVIQEILNNALKYAKANNIWLDLIQHTNNMIISIKDDGIGFDINKLNKNNGIGWQNIYSRIDMLGGEINVESKINNGTKIEIKLPI